MKIALFIVVTLWSGLITARELTPKEKIAVSNLQVIKENKLWAQEQLKLVRLTIRERIFVETAKRGCLPLDLLVEQIHRARQEFPEQVLTLFSLQKGCSDSAHALLQLQRRKSSRN